MFKYTIILVLLMAWIPLTTAQVCETRIVSDIWFRSMTEMAKEKEYPDVIIISNEIIEVWSVPNRGRIIFNLIYKPTGRSQLVAEPNPMPVRLGKIYTFEFGGIYSSFPWHKRDNVPLPLDVEQFFTDRNCGLVMKVEDPETHILVTVVLSVLPFNSEACVTVRLLNPTNVTQQINFSLVICARPGGHMTHDSEIIVSVPTVTVLESTGNWMGQPGNTVTWPAPWRKWGEFKGAGSFRLDVKAMASPEMIVYNPDVHEGLRLRWPSDEGWTSCDVFSWGPNYQSVMGAFDGFRIVLRAEDLLIESGREHPLHLYVSVATQP